MQRGARGGAVAAVAPCSLPAPCESVVHLPHLQIDESRVVCVLAGGCRTSLNGGWSQMAAEHQAAQQC